MNNYKLLCCHESPHDGRYYYVSGNKRRWIPSGEHMKVYGLKPEDVETVTAEVVDGYELSAPLPNPHITYSESISLGDMREFLGNQITGNGIEFGAASNPFPCPIDTTVLYADLFDNHASESPYFNNMSYRNELVKTTFKTGLEEMKGLSDSTYDFVIAVHVIEHVRNPLLALQNIWEKLKPGGKLILIVPHRDLTFDSARDITTLDHLILDYKRPLRERDFLHFIEFYEKAFISANPYERAQQAFTDEFSDIHYHTWNEESFLKMIEYFSENIRKWSKVIYYNHLEQPGANEFYFLLEK